MTLRLAVVLDCIVYFSVFIVVFVYLKGYLSNPAYSQPYALYQAVITECLEYQNVLEACRKTYEERNKQASTAASVAAIAKFETDFKKKIKSHSYDKIGGYDNYCVDLAAVMSEYGSAEGLGVEVNLNYNDYYFYATVHFRNFIE